MSKNFSTLSNSHQMNVLILSTPQDVHAKAVAKHLSALGATHTFFQFDQLINDTKLRLALDTRQSACSLELSDGSQVNLKEVDAVWFRRPGVVRFSGLPEPWMEAMVRNEGSQVIGGIFRSLNDCLLVNHPGRDFDCSFKLYQLEVARRVGFALPETVVTNVPEVVAEFYERCDGRVIYKLVSESSNFLLPKYESLGAPTLPMSEADLGHLSQVAVAPHLFQERIDKVYDIRVTAIGKKLFPVKIDSQAGEGKVDWRTDYSVAMELIALPPDIHEACLTLLRELGLNYGSIDLCVDRDGRHIFFEINCAGQYKWMEERIEGLELSLELARLLTGQSDPMVPRASAVR